jgi:CheY-like chemotaxis protein
MPLEPALPRGTETVLIVDDDEALRRIAVRVLEPLGYTVLTAANADQAFALLGQRAVPPDLLLTDVILPGMGGPEMAELIRAACPGIKVLFVSGYSEDVLPHHPLLARDTAFLQKPFLTNELALRVRATLDG